MRKFAIPAMGAAAMLALSAGTLAAQDTAGAPPPPADTATGTAGTSEPLPATLMRAVTGSPIRSSPSGSWTTAMARTAPVPESIAGDIGTALA